MKRKITRYRESYKQLVAAMVTGGSLRSMAHARTVLKIGGKSTVRRWMEKYHPEGLPEIIERTEDELKRLHPELYKKAKGNLDEEHI
jgi:hypothetical protein